MKKMSLKETISLLKKLDFKPSKKLGQNFLVNKNVLKLILLKSNLNNSDTVVEVGAGLGALTKEMLNIAKKVISFELDKNLYEYLLGELSVYNNIELIYDDVLTAEIPRHDKIISNIPYTISGPLLEKLFYHPNSSPGTLIIEKSISKKLANYRNYQNFSRIAVTFNAFMRCIEILDISRNSFFPIPKINLSLINIVPLSKLNTFLSESHYREFFIKFISGLTQYKNKTIKNAVNLFIKNESSLNMSKPEATNLINAMQIEEKKLFMCDIETLIRISVELYKVKGY
jgi:16S rRNA (adenine1518-N6/adenine1519-N6)-dimethyltransferase